MIDVQEIAKNAADEASKISAEEAAVSEAEGARKAIGETHEAPSNTFTSASTDVEMREADNEDPTTVNHPVLPEVQPTTNPLVPAHQLQQSKAHRLI